jgi:endonuclease G
MKHLRTTTYLFVVALLALESCAHQQSVAAENAPEPGALPRGDSLDGSRHVLLGIPTDTDPSDDYLLDRKYWVASYNPSRLVANWVAWELVADDLGSAERTNAFAADTFLPGGFRFVTPRDYVHSGYDKGHMCPSADRTSTPSANAATFLMTNMQPQRHVLNAGPWEGLERYERGLAFQGKQLEIIAGGIFTNSTTTIGPGVAVPTANFKIVVVMNPGETATDVTLSTPVYAVIMPNSASAKGTKWTQYLVPVAEIEKETGYDFLSKVPAPVQKVIEAKVAAPP